MGNIILRGISSALVVTVLTLLAGMLWSTMGYGGLNPSNFVDFGVIVSCAVAGYRSGKESGVWMWGGLAALGYVSLSIILVALFLPIRGWGVLQILAEGGIIGLLTGALGTGGALARRIPRSGWSQGFSSRASLWNEERSERDQWRKSNYGDSFTDSWQEKNEDIKQSAEAHDFGTDHEGEWEEWMGGESVSPSTTEVDKVYKIDKARGEQEGHWRKTEKKVWWEEDVY